MIAAKAGAVRWLLIREMFGIMFRLVRAGRKLSRINHCPLIAIPTTAGTGTEGNPTAVITNEDTGEKIGIRCCFPEISFVDPDLTLNIPPKYTAWQGFDALFHCMEAILLQKKAIPISSPLR